MLNIQWGEPRPLRQAADTMPFPIDALSPVLRDMAKAISVTISTDVGMSKKMTAIALLAHRSGSHKYYFFFFGL